MAVARRVISGTAPELDGSSKISDHVPCLSMTPEILQARLKRFQDLFELQCEQQKQIPENSIRILIKHQIEHEISGISHVTTPASLMRDVLPKSAQKSCIAAKVIFYDDTAMTKLASQFRPSCSVEDLDEEKDLDGQLWDLQRPLPTHCNLEFIDFEHPLGQHVFWHSSAHLLGEALEQLYGAHLTVGPALEKGFYYDAFLGDSRTISASDYQDIEARLHALIQENQPFQRLDLTKQQALELFKENPFKVALITSKVPDDSTTSCYRCGTLVDLCRGPHVASSATLGSIMIEKHSSAYWLSNADNEQLQRVYGISFPDSKRMKEYQKLMEEVKKRDHRILGNEMNLFFFDPLMSPGSCFWLPDGTKIYNQLIELIQREYRLRGFEQVLTPNIYSCDLFRVSGHLQNYKENMYCLDIESREWALKPMNCPGHCMMFRHMKPSYRQLPIRMADFGVLHRNELSGSLSGLTRVRRFQQDDAHIFCRIDQVQEEVSKALEFVYFVYDTFNFQYDFQLSTRPKKALGDIALWNEAEEALKKALDQSGRPWTLNRGDGAFYGPKIDIQLKDAAYRHHQCGTIQLDFQLPLRFDLVYRSSDEPVEKDVTNPVAAVDGSWETALKPGWERPIIIHRAILGSIERFAAILIEHTSGKLPFWLSPRQICICPVSNQFDRYANYVASLFRISNLYVFADLSSSTLSKKIRTARSNRWNYVIVVGAIEEKDQTVDISDFRAGTQFKKSLKDALAIFADLAQIPSSKKFKSFDDLPPYTISPDS